jgi:hypothetical protein
VTDREDIPIICSLENLPSRMTVKSELVLKNTFFIEKCNKATHQNKNHYLFPLKYESYEALTRKHLFCYVL